MLNNANKSSGMIMFIIIMTVIIFAKIQIISEYTSIMKEKMQFAFLFLKIFLEKRLHIHA